MSPITSAANCPRCIAGEPGRHPDVGGTHWGPSPRVTVTAIIDKLDGTPATERQVELTIRGDYIHMIGGPTGWESAPVLGLAAATSDWHACAGTPGRWDSCVLPLAEIKRGLAELEAIA